MRAAQISRFGGPDVVEVVSDAPVPPIGSTQILVQVKAAGLNPSDWKIRSGRMGHPNLPCTLGGDFCGIVERVGTEVTGFRQGEEVFGRAIVISGGSGTFADYVAVKATAVCPKPRNADPVEAAALPLTGVSAVQALEDHMRLAKGQKILIHGGAGGIGSIAIQIAKSIGAVVYTTVLGKDSGFAQELGADTVIDYTTQRFEETVVGIDAVFDTVGGETFRRSFDVVRRGGVIVSMLEDPDQELSKKTGVEVIGQVTAVTTERLRRLSDHFEKGKIQVYIDRIFPLEEVRQAFEYLESAHTRGKVVVKMT